MEVQNEVIKISTNSIFCCDRYPKKCLRMHMGKLLVYLTSLCGTCVSTGVVNLKSISTSWHAPKCLIAFGED